MKSYYQQRKDGFNLEPVIYAKTVKVIHCYPFFVRQIERIESIDPIRLREKDIENKVVMQHYVTAIEKAIRYVRDGYQEAVWEHSVYEAEYLDLQDKYFLSVGMIRRQVQVFVWAVAEELGESFRD